LDIQSSIRVCQGLFFLKNSILRLLWLSAKKGLEEFPVKKKSPPPVPISNVPLIDTHCHLDMDAYHDDLDGILKKALQNNIQAAVTIGIDVNSSMRAVELARSNSMVSATVGIHPHDVDNITDRAYPILADLIEKNKEHIVGYGEIGLDYVKMHSTPENQRRHFHDQLAFADEFHLPVIIHDREAHDDILTILRKAPLRSGGIMHCFSGNVEFARKVLDLGLHISIPGTVTFKNANLLQEVAKEIPLTSLLLETDSPFLAPHPHRGKRNEPLFLLYTALTVAVLRDISMEELARQTTRNAMTLFGLDIPSS
jgi:TatD DNase family protein